jgi:hypothetical protein
MSEAPEQRELRIITEVGQVAVKHFVERLREWCEQDLHPEKTGPLQASDKAGAKLNAWNLYFYAEKLIEQMNKENE